MFRKLLDAAQKLRVQRQDPEAVAPAVHSMDAIGSVLGRGDGTMVRRMRSTPAGRELLATRHDVLALVSDRAYLRTLPEGSLGRVYVDFAEERGLYPEVLAATVRDARAATGGLVPNATPDAAYLHDRYRDLHDLWHVVTGYGTDMGGEWGLLAFQTKQVGYHSMMLMAFVGCLMTSLKGRFDLMGIWFEGRRRGKRATYLLSQDWERLLTLPLDEVRRELHIGPPPSYRPFDYPKPIEARKAGATAA